MDKSLIVKLMSKSSQASLLFDMARTQNEIKKEQMDEIIQFDVKSADRDGDYVVVFELFISPVFFEMQNNIANPSVEVKRRLNGFKKIFRTSGGGKYQPTSRQGFIDTFEGEMKKYYTKKFAGEVVESDGDELSVMTL